MNQIETDNDINNEGK